MVASLEIKHLSVREAKCIERALESTFLRSACLSLKRAARLTHGYTRLAVSKDLPEKCFQGVLLDVCGFDNSDLHDERRGDEWLGKDLRRRPKQICMCSVVIGGDDDDDDLARRSE